MSDKIVIDQSADGKAALDVRMDLEVGWLNHKQVAEFKKGRRA